MGVFLNNLRKNQAIFSKAMICLGAGWIHFHETTPTYPK
jgi:hypothetical protein